MTWLERNIVPLFFFVLGAVAVFLVSQAWKGCNGGERIVRDTTVVVRVDTVTVPIEKIVVRNLPGRIDTVFQGPEKNPVLRSSVEKVVETREVERVYLDTVRVSYRFPPINEFDIEVALQAREITRIDSTVYIRETVIETATDWKLVGGAVLVGVAIGIAVTK